MKSSSLFRCLVFSMGCLALVATSACNEASSAPMGPDPTGDLDADGIPNAVDACLEAAEVSNGWNDADGCPDSTTELYELARSDVEEYWALASLAVGTPYTPVREFVVYADSVETDCGFVGPKNAFYCPADHGVYLHGPFMDDRLVEVGLFAPTFIVAHEIGHAVQTIHGFDSRTVSPPIILELQADCLAGAYSASSTLRNELGEHDLLKNLKQYLVSLYDAGDPLGFPPLDPRAHGTPGQRIDAFRIGYELGPPLCLSQGLLFLGLIRDQTYLSTETRERD